MKTLVALPKTGASVQFIEQTFRRTDWFGPAELHTAFGVDTNVPPTPALFSETVLGRAIQMDCCIVLQHDQNLDGKPLTLELLHKGRKNKDFLDGTFLYDIGWYCKEPLFTKHAPRPGLFIKGRSIIPESTGKTFVGESLIAADFVEKLFGDELPEQYGTAIEELRANADRLDKLCGTDWKEAARQCVALEFSRLFRETPVEVLYRILLAQKVNRERLFERIYTRTNDLSAGGCVVDVGGADADGALLYRWLPDRASGLLGFSFSCSGELEPAS